MTCEYCDCSGNYGRAVKQIVISDLIDGLIFKQKDVYYLEIDGEIDTYSEINFCPMCGRKLNDKSKLTIYAETDTDYSDEGDIDNEQYN